MIEKEIDLRCKEFFEHVNTHLTKIEGEIKDLKLKLNSDKSEIMQSTQQLVSDMEAKLNINFPIQTKKQKKLGQILSRSK